MWRSLARSVPRQIARRSPTVRVAARPMTAAAAAASQRLRSRRSMWTASALTAATSALAAVGVGSTVYALENNNGNHEPDRARRICINVILTPVLLSTTAIGDELCQAIVQNDFRRLKK